MNFTLRPWTIDDAESLALYANNYEISKNLTDKFPHPYTLENAKAFIAFANGDLPHFIQAIDINGQASGGIGIHFKTDIEYKNAELGYWLAQPFWGKGIMTKAIGQMVDFGFSHYDINRIYARPFGSNVASQKVLEKAGFTLEARFEKTFFKNGGYQDELVYAIRRHA